MYRIFNCGIGMALFVDEKDASNISNKILELGYKNFIIGKVIEKSDNSSINFV